MAFGFLHNMFPLLLSIGSLSPILNTHCSKVTFHLLKSFLPRSSFPLELNYVTNTTSRCLGNMSDVVLCICSSHLSPLDFIKHIMSLLLNNSTISVFLNSLRSSCALTRWSFLFSFQILSKHMCLKMLKSTFQSCMLPQA